MFAWALVRFGELDMDALKDKVRYKSLIVDNLSCALLVVDADKTIVYANREAIKEFGKGIVGKNIKDVVSGILNSVQTRCWDNNCSVFDSSDDIADAGVIHKLDNRGKTKILYFFGSMGNDGQRVLAFVDIDRLLADIEERELILSMLAHEVKNPLTAVRLTAELLARKDISHDQKEGLAQTMDYQLFRLEQLINGAASLLSVNYDRQALKLTQVDVVHTVDNAAKASILGGRSVEIIADSNLPFILSDEQKILHIFINLFSNAVKYSPEGSPIGVRIYAYKGGVRVDVQDWGIGIPKEELPHIFDRFFRGSTAKLYGAEGSGLGLYIVKRLVDMVGGRIDVKSELGSGSTFSVWLPATQGR